MANNNVLTVPVVALLVVLSPRVGAKHDKYKVLVPGRMHINN